MVANARTGTAATIGSTGATTLRADLDAAAGTDLAAAGWGLTRLIYRLNGNYLGAGSFDTDRSLGCVLGYFKLTRAKCLIDDNLAVSRD